MKKILSINDVNEALYYLKEELGQRQAILWKMKNGDLISIKEMSNSHLENTIKLLEKQIMLEDLNGELINDY